MDRNYKSKQPKFKTRTPKPRHSISLLTEEEFFTKFDELLKSDSITNDPVLWALTACKEKQLKVDPKELPRLAKQALDRGNERKVPIKNVHYNIFLSLLVEHGRHGLAILQNNWERMSFSDLASYIDSIIKKMREELIQPDLVTYNTLLNLCAKEKNHEYMNKVLRAMEKRKLVGDTTTLNTLLKLWLDEEDFKKVAETWEKYRKIVEPDQISFTLLGAWLTRVEGLSGSLAAIQTMRDAGIEPCTNAYNVFLRRLQKSADSNGMRSLLDIMQDGLPEGKPNRLSFALYMECLLQAGEGTKALSVVDEMTAAGVGCTLSEYKILIKGACALHDGQLAKAVIERMPASQVAVDAVMLARMVKLFKDIEDKKSLGKAASKLELQLASQGGVVPPTVTLLRAGKVEEAKLLAEAALYIENGLSDMERQKIVMTFIETGKPEQGLEIYNLYSKQRTVKLSKEITEELQKTRRCKDGQAKLPNECHTPTSS